MGQKVFRLNKQWLTLPEKNSVCYSWRQSAVKGPKARIPRASSLDVFSGESCELL